MNSTLASNSINLFLLLHFVQGFVEQLIKSILPSSVFVMRKRAGERGKEEGKRGSEEGRKVSRSFVSWWYILCKHASLPSASDQEKEHTQHDKANVAPNVVEGTARNEAVRHTNIMPFTECPHP